MHAPIITANMPYGNVYLTGLSVQQVAGISVPVAIISALMVALLTVTLIIHRWRRVHKTTATVSYEANSPHAETHTTEQSSVDTGFNFPRRVSVHIYIYITIILGMNYIESKTM